MLEKEEEKVTVMLVTKNKRAPWLKIVECVTEDTRFLSHPESSGVWF